jgi:hypothetical protein
MGDVCEVAGCGKEAARSVSRKAAERAIKGLPENKRRVDLCREHSKEFKKATKESRDLDRLGWD